MRTVTRYSFALALLLGLLVAFISPALGDGAVQLTTDPAADIFPAWSPDGSTIAFESQRAGNYDIWVMPASGGPATPVTTDPATDSHPAWSPDGSMIAFHSDRSGNYDLFLIDVGGPTATTTSRWGHIKAMFK